MKKVFVKIFIAVSLLPIIVVSGAYLFRHTFEQKVKSLLIEAINEQVTVPVTITGGIDFSLFSHFPYASLTFREVAVKSALPTGPAQLLAIKELSFLFNVLGLMTNHIEVSRIYAHAGVVNIYLDNNGYASYDIFKKSNRTKSQNPLSLDLKKATIEQLKFNYLSESKSEEIRLGVKELNLSGNFKNQLFDLSTQSDIAIERIKINGEEYLSQRSFQGTVLLGIDQQQSRFTIKQALVVVDDNNFNVAGYFITGKARSYISLRASSSGSDVSHLLVLLPAKLTDRIKGAEGKGKYEIEAVIQGSIKAGSNPLVKVAATLDRATLKIPRLSQSLNNVAASGYYLLDSMGADHLEIKRFHSELQGEPFNLSLVLSHLTCPSFDIHAYGVVNLRELKSFFSDSTLQEVSGKIAFKNLHISGTKADLDQPERLASKIAGDLTLQNIAIKAQNVNYNHISGSLAYHDETISAQGLSLNFLETDVAFSGTITKLLPYIVNQSKREYDNAATLGITGELSMKELNLSAILNAYDKKRNPLVEEKAGKIDIRNIFNAEGNLKVNIDRLTYNHLKFEEVKTSLDLVPYRINIPSLSCHAMGGEIINSGYISFAPSRELILNLGLQIDKVDLPRLFEECDNFDQKTLTNKNLKGLLTAGVELKTVWRDYKDIDMSKVVGNISCSVLHGELLNFEPLRNASAFIKMEELNHIVFSELTNQFYIHDRKITIPRMEIQSSALNLLLSGTHTFDNAIDYHIKVNLHKLLAAKYNHKNEDVQYIEEDPYAGVNLYLLITGTTVHPLIKYDRESVKKKMKQDLVAQKEELKNLFKKEKPDTKKTEVKKEEKYYDTRKKPEYIDFEEEKKE